MKGQRVSNSLTCSLEPESIFARKDIVVRLVSRLISDSSLLTRAFLKR